MPRDAVSIGSLGEIVTNGLCIGCGLCEAIAGPQRVQMVMTPEGRVRPYERQPLDEATFESIKAVCPGTRIEGPSVDPIDQATATDAIWGPYRLIVRGWAGNAELRFKAATGGVLTTLALHLLETKQVGFVLHVEADPDRPMRSRWRLSFDRADLLRGIGSRYGPAAPLAGLEQALSRDEPFAFIGKPCDVGALRSLARHDPRVGRLCQGMLAMVCDGASELGKSLELLDRFGVLEQELRLFRYRGHGNPGPTRIETKDGCVFETTYNEMWADEAGWRLQFRCKICPDAIGEVADVAALDVWPGGSPEGDDEGFNGILVRTMQGDAMVRSAVEAGHLVVDDPLLPRQLDDFQPHQVRKKRAVWARLAGLRRAGHPVPEVVGLRIEDLARQSDLTTNLREAKGAMDRARAGRASEPLVRPEASAMDGRHE